MTFKELKEAIQTMDYVALEQNVWLHTGDEEFVIDMVVKFDGTAMFVKRIEGEYDDDAMDAGQEA